MQAVYVVAAVRTAIGKAPRGSLRNTRPDDLAAFAIQGALARVPQLEPKQIEDVVLGCAVPEAEQGMNVARIAVLRAGLPVDVPAATVNRMCASGLEAIAIIAQRIMTGQIDVGVAGGTESMSMAPMEGHVFRPNPYLTQHYPDAYLGMGMTTENLVVEYGITREEADQFALESHQKALRAQAEGAFDGEIVPVEVHEKVVKDGTVHENRFIFDRDEGPRADTSMEALAKLKPVFKADGTVTAGNASQRSDGAAAVVLMSERMVNQLGAQPLARFVGYAVAGVPPETMGIGPRLRHPQTAATLRQEHRRHRPVRDQRGVRSAGACGAAPVAHPAREAECERRGSRAGASAGRDRFAHDRHFAERAGQARRQVGRSQHVRWRRHGRSRAVRAGVAQVLGRARRVPNTTRHPYKAGTLALCAIWCCFWATS
jgi:acetyl-CoA acyltransferase